MIAYETIYRSDGVELLRIYSDEGYKIRQEETGYLYDEAVDIPEYRTYTYTETDIPIENDDVSEEEALRILLGGEPYEPQETD